MHTHNVYHNNGEFRIELAGFYEVIYTVNLEPLSAGNIWNTSVAVNGTVSSEFTRRTDAAIADQFYEVSAAGILRLNVGDLLTNVIWAGTPGTQVRLPQGSFTIKRIGW